MQYFYINQNSNLPNLRVELVNDGKYDFLKSAKICNAIQNAEVTFSMRDENERLVISEAPCSVIFDNDSCEERCILEYQWKTRDTKEKGQFKGQFKISFEGGLTSENNMEFPEGDLIVPIYEDLYVMIK